MSRRAVPRGSQRATKPKRRRTRRPDLNSLVQPHTAAEAQWLRRQGQGGPSAGVGGTLRYAMVLAYGSRFDEALRLCDEAQRRYPLDHRIPHTRANIRMLSGDLSPSIWTESWRGVHQEKRVTQPRWNGDPRPGQTILLWDNFDKGLGLGDAVQLVRLAPVVKAQSEATVMVAVPAGMKRLLSGLPGVDELVEPPLPTDGFAYQVALTLLPGIPGCELTPERLSVVPYLFAEDDARQRWAPTFDTSRINIGLHWRADTSHTAGQQRSLKASDLAPLFSLSGARFYSLQNNGGAELKAYPEVVNLGNIDDPASRFVESAGVMRHLDLIVACDSGVAHVAGALGVPVILLIHIPWDVRWGVNQETPWYPGHTVLHRSPSSGGWDELVCEVREVLESDIQHGTYRRT